MKLTSVFGSLCSGSLVAPRVVMTAKHCLDEGSFGWAIGFGARGNETPVDIETAILAEDHGAPVYQDEDMAFAILQDPVLDVTPYAMPWAGDGLEEGDEIRLIGYGNTETGEAGRKYEGQDDVWRVGTLEFQTVGEGVCGGDSGGSALTADRTIVGVIVRGPEGCNLPPPDRGTALTRVSAWLDLAREAFDLTDACYPTGEEACDGRDNDCNGETDEVCDPIGAACETAETCASRRCEALDGAMQCTAACDPRAPAATCPEGALCRESGCGEGLCVPGQAGPAAFGEACAADAECASARCGASGCTTLCELGTGACPPGLVCAAQDDAACSFGECVEPADAPSGPRLLGEPCERDGDCLDRECLGGSVEANGGYCSRSCSGPATEGCPPGYRCEDGACRRGDPGQPGDPCVANTECGSGVCAHWANADACTEDCSEDQTCPEGLSCVATSGNWYCRPDRAPTGETCYVNGDCLHDLCADFESGDFCTEVCDEASPCPIGFECVASTTGGVRICARHGMQKKSSGCGVAPSAGGRDARSWLGVALTLGAFVLAPILVRRRTRRHPQSR